ncbi:unnamed protein product, partial [Brenthis ino]
MATIRPILALASDKHPRFQNYWKKNPKQTYLGLNLIKPFPGLCILSRVRIILMWNLEVAIVQGSQQYWICSKRCSDNTSLLAGNEVVFALKTASDLLVNSFIV